MQNSNNVLDVYKKFNPSIIKKKYGVEWFYINSRY